MDIHSTKNEFLFMKKPAFLFLLSPSINLGLFSIFLLLFKPIYDTNEDVYILYLLSGGFGNAPTELLHYNYGMHPYLNIFIKNMFIYQPAVNWYSIVLLLSHYLACCIILFQLLKRNQRIHAIFLYITLFIIFEGRLLLSPNFTNTAIILGSSAIILLFTIEKNRKYAAPKVILAILILLFASFFRIHVLIPLVGISIPFLFLIPSPNKFFIVPLALIVVTGLVLLFNYMHRSYYKAAITGWEQEEGYRQKIYSFYNHHTLNQPGVYVKWNTEMGIITHGSPIDTNFLSTQRLLAMEKDLKRRTINTHNNSSTKNWFWINNRIFFCAVFLILALSVKTKSLFVASTVSLILIITGLYILHSYAKSTEYLQIACLFLFSLFVVLYCVENDFAKRFPVILTLLILLLSIWGFIRLYKTDRKNIQQSRQFRLSASELSKYRNRLFVLTSDTFPLQKFYIFDIPGQYLLPNFLGSEHFLQNLYKPAFERFQIKEIRELPANPNVLFWGKRVPALEDYFRKVNNRKILVSEIIKDFRYGEVRSIFFQK